MSELSSDEIRNIMKYAISRLDGAWFRVVAGKYGISEAADLDAKVWYDWMKRVAQKIKKTLKLDESEMDSVRVVFPKISEVLSELLGLKGETIIAENKLIPRITQCEYWENIKKAGLLCSKVHVSGYMGILEGAFPERKFEFTHTKRIPDGDPYCEVVIKIIS